MEWAGIESSGVVPSFSRERGPRERQKGKERKKEVEMPESSKAPVEIDATGPHMVLY